MIYNYAMLAYYLLFACLLTHLALSIQVCFWIAGFRFFRWWWRDLAARSSLAAEIAVPGEDGVTYPAVATHRPFAPRSGGPRPTLRR